MLNKEMLLDAAQKTGGGDTFDVVEHSGFLYYGVNALNGLESMEFRPYSLVQLSLSDSPDPSVEFPFYSYAAVMLIPNILGIESPDFMLTTNVVDPFNAYKTLRVDSSDPLY